jgi:hypothetical protein
MAALVREPGRTEHAQQLGSDVADPPIGVDDQKSSGVSECRDHWFGLAAVVLELLANDGAVVVGSIARSAPFVSDVSSE